MTEIQRQLDLILQSTQRRLIESQQLMPVRTHQGILVGSVKIVSKDTLKDLWQFDQLVYQGIFLNKAAIKLANLLAIYQKHTITTDKLYHLDQDYGKHFVNSQQLLIRLQQAKNSKDYDKVDIYLARYTQAKDQAEIAKRQVLALAAT
jgi:hypothetical protein